MSSFINKYRMPKSTPGLTPKLPHTNTQIKGNGDGVFGGRFNVPADKYEEFINANWRETRVSQGKYSHLTEAPLEDDNGPILIDLDFRYATTVVDRRHDATHVRAFVDLYVEEMEKVFDIDPSTTGINFFVSERLTTVLKPDRTNIANKDGIHILIGVQCSRNIQILLRNRILARLRDDTVDDNVAILNTLPITNSKSWSDVFDEAITKGSSPWPVYGSTKPYPDGSPGCYDPYLLTYVYEYANKSIRSLDPEIFISGNIFLLSARNPGNQALFTQPNFATELAGIESAHKPTMLNFTCNNAQPTYDIYGITNKAQLDASVEHFLSGLQPVDHELVEISEYVMALGINYYGIGMGTYSKWQGVGWALRHIDNRMFIIWMAMSAKADGFNYADILANYTKWQAFQYDQTVGATRKYAIMAWTKQDNPDEYERIRHKSLDHYIDQTLSSPQVANSSKSQLARGASDNDIARVLRQMFKDQYVCVHTKNNTWYRYRNHKWVNVESGTSLRKSISEELRAEYLKKYMSIQYQMTQHNDHDSPQYSGMKKRADCALNIIGRLGDAKGKNSIMVEAKELFYDSEFMAQLDTNPYITCFKNGVIDFTSRANVFRAGLPDDYITMSTNIKYDETIDLATNPHAAEINIFMGQLFVDEGLRQYMWEHLASMLIGASTMQTCNIYKGSGRNGKTLLMELMALILGDYKRELPVSFLTEPPGKMGGTSTELAELKGARLALITELTAGTKLHEGPFKSITGFDLIKSRRLYAGETVNFTPQCKLVICTNTDIDINTQCPAVWARVKKVDFDSVFTPSPHKNPEITCAHQFAINYTLKDQFPAWKEVFMYMLVQVAFRTNGMVADCDKVIASSKLYKEQQDFTIEFINEKIETCSKFTFTSKTIIAQQFTDWFRLLHGRAPKRTDINSLVARLELLHGKQVNVGWAGIKIKNGVVSEPTEGPATGDEVADLEEEDDVTVGLNEL